MLFILADVYRIATFRALEPPQDPRGATERETGRRRNWFRVVGLLR